MFRTVDVPIWLLVLILAFAAVTFASHFLFPSVRWFLRRRAERLVERLNRRLERPIQPFKLARRHDMIQRLLYDPRVAEAIAGHAREEGVPENVAFERARRYAREIVPAFSASAYFGFATRAARWLSRALYDVHLEPGAEAELAAIDPEATVVFVMNHRSNMDYVLVTYLVAERSALSYAVGEWARVWPLSSLIRAMGAFFIRRRSRNTLYRRVLARYVQLATAAGVTQAVFPEGGLSLTGGVEPPKLGFLSYILAGFEPGSGRDVVFVPVALAYDRVLEDRVLVQAQEAGVRRFRASLPVALRFALRHAWRRLRGRGRRFGHAAVRFGRPLSLDGFLDGRPGHATHAVAAELMSRIRAAVPVLPVPLVAQALLVARRPLARDALAAAVAAEIARLDAAPVVIRDPDEAVAAALATLELRRLVVEGADGIAVAPGQEPMLAFYAASVAQHLGDAVPASATGQKRT